LRSLVVDIFERFSGLFPAGEGSFLKAEEIQASAMLPGTDSPVCTLLVRSQYSGKDEAVSLVLMTEPSLATDDQRILDFAARRSRAYKCPFFLTWNLRDTILWCTPKPGRPSSRDYLKKLRDYPDLYEISTAEDQIVSELTKLKVLERGRDILGDLEKLVKDEALELVDIDATYFVGRLVDAVHSLFPLVSKS